MGCGSSMEVGGGKNQWTKDQLRSFKQAREAGTQKLRDLVHTKARQTPYQGGQERYVIEDIEVPWPVDVKEYDEHAVEFTSPIVLKGPPWADKPDVRGVLFNSVDKTSKVDRTSFEGTYQCDHESNRPLNPRGRTGMSGRGLLGRFGPNHAADPVITKWARDWRGNLIRDVHGRRQLEFVAIKRKDTGDWAIPGGMVDPGESVSLTLKREFGEETMNALELPPEEHKRLMSELEVAFRTGLSVYSGYVDDIRNTDNAWMETTCVNFHDEEGKSFSKFKLKAGDDAGEVAWTRYYKGMPLYATHTNFLEIVARMHGLDVDYERVGTDLAHVAQ